MPVHACANGMWRGPDPVELSELTYAECKVINLGRIYVSVKRIFLIRASYARRVTALCLLPLSFTLAVCTYLWYRKTRWTVLLAAHKLEIRVNVCLNLITCANEESERGTTRMMRKLQHRIF